MRSLLLIVVLVASGCVAPAAIESAPAPSAAPALAFPPGARVPIDCWACYEPTIAVDGAGRIFVTDGITADVAVSADGGVTWEAVAPPPMPPGAPGFQTDVLVQAAPSGRMYWSALVMRAVPGFGGALLESLQVAWTEDGGRTWTSSLASPLADPSDVVLIPDRQWLAFGEGGTVYMTYNQIPTGIWIARSDDGGASWGGWTRAVSVEGRGGGAGQSGAPVVDADGRVIVPACATGGMAVFVSEDGGASFARRDVPEMGCNWFPMVALAPGGALVAASQDGADVRVAVSRDAGVTWSKPALWGEGATAAPWPMPTADGALELAWFESGERAALHLARGPLEGAPTEDVLVAEDLGGASRTNANTDFASAARLLDGRLALTWARNDDGQVLVSVASS